MEFKLPYTPFLFRSVSFLASDLHYTHTRLAFFPPLLFPLVCPCSSSLSAPNLVSVRLGDDVDNVMSLVETLYDAVDNLPGAKLIALGGSALEQGLYSILPENGGGDLAGKDLFDDFRIRMGLSVHIGNDRDPRGLEGGGGEGDLELINGGLHELGVESTGDGQTDGLAGLELLAQLLDGFAALDGSRDRVVARAEEVGDFDGVGVVHLSAGGFTELLDLGGVETNNGNHTGRSRVGGGLHAFATDLDETETVFEADGAGESQGGVLTEGKTGGNVDGVNGGVTGVLTELLDGGEGRHVNSGLTHGGAVELLLGTLDTDLQEIVTQNGRGFVEKLLGSGDRGNKLLGHTNGLSALAGEISNNVGLNAIKFIVLNRPRFNGRSMGNLNRCIGEIHLGPTSLDAGIDVQLKHFLQIIEILS